MQITQEISYIQHRRQQRSYLPTNNLQFRCDQPLKVLISYRISSGINHTASARRLKLTAAVPVTELLV